MRRWMWRVLLPAVHAANAVGWLSYKWVNVCRSAWMTPETGFGALWHHRWFGDPIDTMPRRVNLGGIMYRVAVAEGLVCFNCDDGMSRNRLEFTRDPHDQHAMLWYVDLSQHCPASHFNEAYEWIRAVYGGSHEIKKQPLRQSAPVES